MKNIIVYDFDKTIFKKETSMAFTFFYLGRHPKKIFVFLKSIFRIIFHIKSFSLKEIKGIFFEYIRNDNKIEKEIELFWEKNKKYIFPYFKEEIDKNKKEADYLVLISASPSFLLDKIYKKLGFDVLIATKYDKDYNLIGENCKGIEKVNRLNKRFQDYHLLKFYSDSLSDLPLYNISCEKFWINKKGELLKGLPKKNGMVDKWK